MSTLYDLIFELKTELTEKQQLRIELVNGGSIIRKEDKVSCIDNVLIIVRKDLYCLIPLENIIRVRSELR